MKCHLCGAEFEDGDSLGSPIDLCQECWESECDKAWWEMWDRMVRINTEWEAQFPGTPPPIVVIRGPQP